MDVGTGDGRAMLTAARQDPARLFIGIDSHLDGLQEASTRAARKPARGGVSNAWFVHASAERLPAELAGVADRVTVLLPWGSLLAGVLRPGPDVLCGLRALARPGAAFEVVTSLDDRDGTDLPHPTRARLMTPYRAAGWRLHEVDALDARALAEVGTTWAKRLAYGRPRTSWRLRAVADG